MSTTFQTLPPELLEVILDLIDHQSDMLNLSLTCHSLSYVVSTDRCRYRRISTTNIVRETHLWAHLAENAHLIRHVRYLWIGCRKRRAPNLQSQVHNQLASNAEDMMIARAS